MSLGDETPRKRGGDVTDLSVTNQWRPTRHTNGPSRANQQTCYQITCNILYSGNPRYLGKEKPRSCLVSKSTIRPDQTHSAEDFRYIRCYMYQQTSATTTTTLGQDRIRDHAGSRTVDSRTVESIKGILPHYSLLIYTGRTQGYIRTLIHVSSLVLRLQSYIVTCVYLLDYCDSLLDYNLTTLTSRPILRYRSTRRSHWHRSSISQ